MTHASLVDRAVQWLRSRYGCHIILSEQTCCTGETPDVIGWKKANRSILVECKISRADYLADAKKPWREDSQGALGCERYYLAPAGMIRAEELPAGWGLLEARGREIEVAVRCSPRKSLRTQEGLENELNLLLASLRRVEIRIEPQSVTEFLKWENRMARYNGGQLPQGVEDPNKRNSYLV